jgi:hypothetical protein
MCIGWKQHRPFKHVSPNKIFAILIKGIVEINKNKLITEVGSSIDSVLVDLQVHSSPQYLA